MNDTITDVISNVEFNRVEEQEEKSYDNQIITSTAKKIIKSRK